MGKKIVSKMTNLEKKEFFRNFIHTERIKYGNIIYNRNFLSMILLRNLVKSTLPIWSL